MIDINELRQSLGAIRPEEVDELLDRLEAAEKDNQRKRKRIEQLEYALRAMTKTYKSVAYAQWPAEIHLANEVLEESK